MAIKQQLIKDSYFGSLGHEIIREIDALKQLAGHRNIIELLDTYI